jgi:lipopolysaccharide assembly outer membrane protein LptD (OstA)
LSETHVRLTGEVEIDGGTWGFSADQVDLFSDDSRLLAYGNVNYTAEGSRVAADRVEFNTETLTGTFYNAFGSIVLVEDVERSMFGSQEPDMYFYGESIERLGPRTYRLTKGGFTSCIQPTPRWQMTASTLTLNLDNYALLRNSILSVKGVPVFYLPIMYYPIQGTEPEQRVLLGNQPQP